MFIEELLQSEILDEADLSRHQGGGGVGGATITSNVASRVVKDVRLAKAFLSKSGRIGPPTPDPHHHLHHHQMPINSIPKQSPSIVVSSSFDAKRGNMFKAMSYTSYHSDETFPLVTKNLLAINRSSINTPVRNIKQYRIPSVEAGLPLYDMLTHFQSGRSHMAMVLDEKDRMTCIGIITLEDVIEELLQTEILDEADLSRHQGGGGATIASNVASRVVKDVRLAKAFLSKSGRIT
eukprot:TRINITY_DN2602_c0_g1_i7.p2 TRINITY_DN2602_c0_g1~~TRINITY_DN2602_c0_g1_i7.p2  ORF type:complete len:236 (-),score=65.89 TRINITY_DN2602_c0_g1_i7:207-914(-)